MKRLYSALVLSVAVCAGVNGQAFYNNGSVTVQSSGSIYVNGKMQVDVNGSVSNDGTIQILGDYENDRTDGAITYASTPGTVKFTNNGNIQNLSAPNASQLAFNNLESDNSVATIAGVVSAGPVSATNILVNNNLTFNGDGSGNGGIVMNSNNLTLGLGATITNGGPSNYAYFTNNGTTSGTFGQLITSSSTGSTPTFPYYMGSEVNGGPVGYVPASFNFFDIPTQANKIAVSFYPQADIGTINYVGQCNLPGYPGNNIMLNEMVSNFGYWQIDVSDASNTNIDNISGWLYNATLVPSYNALNYMYTNYGSAYYKLLKIQSHDNEGDLLSPPTSSTDWSTAINNSGDACDGFALINNSENITTASTSGITATNLSSFSRFGGGGNGGGGGLPITLVSLTAVPVDNSFIRIDWTTAVEINNAGFEVQKSLDGVNFGNMDWVAGSGNSTEPIQYYTDDKEVSPNVVYYYRLNQIDMNGNSHLSDIVSANLSMDNVFTVGDFVPNPTANSSRINIVSSSTKKINVTLYNTLGEIIDQKTDFTVMSGSTAVDFDLSNVAAGTYFAEIVADQQVFNKKLVVNK